MNIHEHAQTHTNAFIYLRIIYEGERACPHLKEFLLICGKNYCFGDFLSAHFWQKVPMKSFLKICRSELTLSYRFRHSRLKLTHTT